MLSGGIPSILRTFAYKRFSLTQNRQYTAMSINAEFFCRLFCWLLCIPPFSQKQGAYALVINFYNINSLESSTLKIES